MPPKVRAREWEHVTILKNKMGKETSSLEEEQSLMDEMDMEEAANGAEGAGSAIPSQSKNGSSTDTLRHPLVKCNYCDHEFHGGATRIRQHFLGDPKKKDVRICLECPKALTDSLQKWVQESEAKKAKKRCLEALDMVASATGEDSARKKGPAQGTIASMFKRAKQTELDDAWERAFVANGIAFNVANDPSFRAAVRLTAGTACDTYELPKYNAMRGPLLERARKTVEEELKVRI